MSPEAELHELEIQPQSRLNKIGRTVTTVGFIAIPTTLYGVALYYGVKTAKLKLEYLALANEAMKNAR